MPKTFEALYGSLALYPFIPPEVGPYEVGRSAAQVVHCAFRCCGHAEDIRAKLVSNITRNDKNSYWV